LTKCLIRLGHKWFKELH